MTNQLADLGEGITSKHYQKRLRAASRFKWYGRLAIGFALLMLVLLLVSIVSRGWSGFLKTEVLLPTNLIVANYTVSAEPQLNEPPIADQFELQKREASARLRSAMMILSGALVNESSIRNGMRLISMNARREVGDYLKKAEDGFIIDEPAWITTSDDVDLWMKGKISLEAMVSSGRINETQARLLKSWQEMGSLRLAFNTRFFTAGDSREPELAGFAASIVGSLLTVFMCLLVAFPLGVMTAVYLEEFAAKNRWSDLIEVNINNLAAVPSIVFGLLGLALYLSLFGMPRSAALVGGLTLALLILPVIIIATRASLRAVPPSIRDAARGLGATELQVVWHHVLPLSLPGIMTGTILGIARAMGETAPLLMIGMVAFIADVPRNLVDPATAMPVQIFLWASSPELGFIEKTAAGIMVLLAILLCMNMVAIILRNKFEQKW